MYITLLHTYRTRRKAMLIYSGNVKKGMEVVSLIHKNACTSPKKLNNHEKHTVYTEYFMSTSQSLFNLVLAVDIKMTKGAE